MFVASFYEYMVVQERIQRSSLALFSMILKARPRLSLSLASDKSFLHQFQMEKYLHCDYSRTVIKLSYSCCLQLFIIMYVAQFMMIAILGKEFLTLQVAP